MLQACSRSLQLMKIKWQNWWHLKPSMSFWPVFESRRDVRSFLGCHSCLAFYNEGNKTVEMCGISLLFYPHDEVRGVYRNHNVCVSGLFWETYLVNHPTRLSMVIQLHELQHHVNKMDCYLQGQDHMRDDIMKIVLLNRTVSTACSELLILLQPNLVWS